MADAKTAGHPSIAAALAAAQGEFEPIVKNRKVKFSGRDYLYADLSDVLATVRPTLAKHGLALTQTVAQQGERTGLVTMLLHASGEKIESVMPINCDLAPQAFGSMLSYMRRYMVQSILGVAAEEDDDGQLADDEQRSALQQRQQQRQERREPSTTANQSPPANGHGHAPKPDIVSRAGAVVASCPSYGHAVEYIEQREKLEERVELSIANRKLLAFIGDSQKAPKDLRDRAEALWNLGTDEALNEAA